MGPTVLGGMLMHPGARAGEVLRFFREFMADAPDEVGVGVALITAPPELFVPEPVRGKPAAGIIVCYAGPVEDGKRVLAPLREFGPPVLDMVKPMPYTEVQQLIDPMNPPGLQNYWGGDFLTELSDDAIEVFCSAHGSVPSPHTLIVILAGGGQIARVDDHAMALGQRQAPYNTHLIAMWPDPADSQRNIEWVRDLRAASEPHATGGAFLNFLGEEGQHHVRRAFGTDKYQRLVQIKDRYDPWNLFRLNQNIPPSGGGTR